MHYCTPEMEGLEGVVCVIVCHCRCLLLFLGVLCLLCSLRRGFYGIWVGGCEINVVAAVELSWSAHFGSVLIAADSLSGSVRVICGFIITT